MNASPFSGARVLITGGLGFIGSHLGRRLVQEGARVTLVDSLIPQYGGNLFNIVDYRDRATVNIADVRDPHAMGYLVRDQEYLFNLAGQTSHLDSMTDPFTDLDINARAQLAILEACRLHNPRIQIVFASTRQLYGRPLRLPVDEQHPIQPVDVNGIHKLAGEGYHLLYHSVYGIRSSALRLTNTYGPGMRIKDARQTFLGIWLRLILEGKPFEVWEGQQLRDFTYVDDCVEAMLLAAANPAAHGRIFNLGGERALSLIDLARLVVQANNGKGEFIQKSFPAERKRIDIGDYYSDWSSIKSSLGWSPKVPVEDGVRRSLDYFRQHIAHYI